MEQTNSNVVCWLTKDILQEALCRVENDPNLIVDSFEVKNALAPGENYFSDMFQARVILRGASKPRSVIIKVKPDGERGMQMTQTRIFPRETNMYTATLPQMNGLLANSYPPFAPKHLHSGVEPHTFIMLEDLKEIGFANAPRQNCLDLPHCQLVMQTLGRFHACSIAILQKDNENELIRTYGRSIYQHEGDEVFGSWMETQINTLVRELGSDSDFGEKLSEYSSVAYGQLQRNSGYKEDNLNVLQHGDLWLNNILFKYDGHKPAELRFVDFQISAMGCPAFDLQYFLFSSANRDVLRDHLDELIETYHSALMDTLNDLGFDHLVMTVNDLKQRFDDHYCIGLYAAVIIRPIVMADSEMGSEIQQSFADALQVEGNQVESSMYSNKDYIESLLEFLPLFDEKGCFLP